MVQPIFPEYPALLDDDGAALAGGSVTFYERNTTTEIALFTSDGVTPQDNPVDIDAAGNIPVVLVGDSDATAGVKAVIKDNGGATIRTIPRILSGSAASSAAVTPGGLSFGTLALLLADATTIATYRADYGATGFIYLEAQKEGLTFLLDLAQSETADSTTAGGVGLVQRTPGRQALSGDSVPYNRMISNARYGEPVHLMDLLTKTQQEGVQEHTITDDLSSTVNTLLTDDRAINIALPQMGLIPIASTLAITESQYTNNGIRFGSSAIGPRARPVGGKTDLVIKKQSGFSGYAIDVNAAGTSAIQKVHLAGFTVDGDDEGGGGVRIRYAQDVDGRFTVENDQGYGILLDGVWNSPFHNLMAKNCQAGGLVLDPVTRENSNLSFYDPWIARCGGDGELFLKHNASNSNGTVQFFNPLIEAVLATGATDSDAMVVVENAKRLDFFGGIITSPDGRDAYCVQVDASSGGTIEAVSFTSTDFNNTGTKTRHNVINMDTVETGAIHMVNVGKKGSDRFAKSNAATQPGALTVIGGRNLIAAATDTSDLADALDIKGFFDGVDIGNKGSAASAARSVSTTAGKNYDLGATATGGAELTARLDPDAGTLNLNDYQIILKNTTAPSSASDTGTTGEVRWAANFLYVCVAANTWERVAIATW